MISRIEGILISKKPPCIEINTHGITYEILAPMGTFYALQEIHATVMLFTHFVVREDAQQLYGFATASDRDLFRVLIKVNGVGPKLALTILSGMSTEQFVTCISTEDSDQLTRIPGIGKKTAQRLLLDIKDRLATMSIGSTDLPTIAQQAVASSPQQDAIAALTTLGYKPTDAKKAVHSIHSDETNSEQIIKAALQWLTVK